MTESTVDLMKIWTQHDQLSELAMKGMLLCGLDAVVGEESDVLSKIKVDRPATSPVVRWLEEWEHPCHLTAQLAGNTLHVTGHLFGNAVGTESVSKVLREGTILESAAGGGQVKITGVDGLAASVVAYGNTQITDDPDPVQNGTSLPRSGPIFAMQVSPALWTEGFVKSGHRYSQKPSRFQKQERTRNTKSFLTRPSTRSLHCWPN